MVKDDSITQNVPEVQAAPEKPQRQNAKWVGPIIAYILPGSAHFLAGQRRTGVKLLFIWLLLGYLVIVLLGIPGAGFFYAAVFFFAVFILFIIAMLISSWRRTQALGCGGVLLFIGAVVCLHYAIFLSVTLIIKPYFVELYVGEGTSMTPTLVGQSKFAPEGLQPDRRVVNKLIYRVSNPQRGDIVTYKTLRDGLPVILIKRIVALPGETVDIEPPYVRINGERLLNPPIFAKMASKQDGFTGYCTAQDMGIEGVLLPLTLGADEYFLLGDNSPWSKDSRFFGPVHRRDITGKVVRIWYPIERIREIE